MADNRGRRCGASGFTLVEVLVAVVLLGLIAVSVAAISIPGVLRISDDNQERQLDATTAQWSSVVFARDVQGAGQLGAPGDCTSTGDPLVALVASDELTPTVEYRVAGAGPFELVRAECGGTERTVVEGLDDPPAVECRDAAGSTVACTPGTSPRVVNLEVDRTDSFGFELDGARRATGGAGDPPPPPPLEVPDFVALGGAVPLSIGGTSRIEVVGNAYINAPTPGVVVNFNGGATLDVSGDFKLQDGGTCPDCGSNANTVPGSYAVALPDPLRFVPAPDASALSVRTDCPVTPVDGEDRRVCQPGVYPVEFPPSGPGGGVKDYVLDPGVYVLQDGLRMTNGSITGDGVLLYNETGSISVQGGDLDLEPAPSGQYADLLVVQARDNANEIRINGNGAIASLAGTIYAPGSSGVILGTGTADMYVGRIIGTSLSTSGSGTVTVGGG